MSRRRLWCDLCARLQGSSLNEAMTHRTYYCEAYPEGIPEPVFHAGHLYPKPGDNGLQFKPRNEKSLEKYSYLKQSQEEEEESYQDFVEFYEELDMTYEEFAEKMKREHGEDWHLYKKPIRESDGGDGYIVL